MPVSHHHEAIFVHIPKCGGGSIERALGVYGRDNKGSNKFDEKILYGMLEDPNAALQHLTALQIQKRMSSELFRKYFKFSIVRNPYSKLASAYFWRKKYNPSVRHMTFKKFLHDFVMPNKAVDPHFICQKQFVTDSNSELVVDYVGRFETFKQDTDKILDMLGIDNLLPHLHDVKPTRFFHYSDLYDRESRALVKTLYRHDLQFFDYQFSSASKSQRFVNGLGRLRRRLRLGE